ncbi:hypothetical protein HOLleu_19944 [Holothuria leucospilota]|uniref:Uncharacterized protein n=1 Tax=Holothuria leucospilota TaxID=206669 RepID=A0A9Q1C039_HOLLE|nr:hypothetical protein HOLleu_19944 [Holothuria leucospilota]
MGLIGGFLFGLCFSCVGLFGGQLWHFFIFMGTTAVGVGLLDFACFMSFIVHFKTNYQSLNSIRKLFAYVGITLIPPLVELLRSKFGFNGAYLILGAICWNGVVCPLLLKDDKTHQKCSCSHSSKKKSYDLLNGNTSGDSHKDQDTQTKDKGKLIVCNLRLLSSVTSHPLYSGLILTEGLFYYNFVIWAIFLVPFGRSVGLKPSAAVFLSTAGGFGGLIGKLVAFLVCYVDKMNAISAFLVPALLCNCGVFGYIITKNSLSLYIFSSICGFSFAFSDTALSGMVPRYVCSYHLRQGAAIGYIVTGTFMQLGGIISGQSLKYNKRDYPLPPAFPVTKMASAIQKCFAHTLYCYDSRSTTPR